MQPSQMRVFVRSHRLIPFIPNRYNINEPVTVLFIYKCRFIEKRE